MFLAEDYGDTWRGFMYMPTYWYSRLLTNVSFWDSIESKYVLTIQSDTLLCYPQNLANFYEMNYLGGASFFNKTFNKNENYEANVTRISLKEDPSFFFR